MWESYHIYNHSYHEFLKELKVLSESIPEYFFTVYSDYRGGHFRLRIRSSKYMSKEYSNVKELFGDSNVIQEIYDPEVLKYKNNLCRYEVFSVFICKHIVENFDRNQEESIIDCISIIKEILYYFHKYEKIFIMRSMNYWVNNYKYFKGSLKKDVYYINRRIEHERDFIIKFKKILDSFIIDCKNKEQLIFNINHMTINRFNLNPKDEMRIYNILLKGSEFVENK